MEPSMKKKTNEQKDDKTLAVRDMTLKERHINKMQSILCPTAERGGVGRGWGNIPLTKTHRKQKNNKFFIY